MNKNMVMDPEGVRNQERLCWRGPAAIYGARLGWANRCQEWSSEGSQSRQTVKHGYECRESRNQE
jgi:hypothetical protein